MEQKQPPVTGDNSPRDIPGVWIDDGREYVGVIRHLSRTREPLCLITDVRASEELRRSWPADRQVREHEAWERLKTVDALYWRRRLGQDHRDDSEAIRKERNRARRSYWRVVEREIERERRVTPRVRRQVIEAWEAQGRICSLCEQVVQPNEKYHVHHITPVIEGGTRDPGNLAVVHDVCNLRWGSGQIVWVMSWSKEKAPCVVCGRNTDGVIRVRHAGAVRATLQLCGYHRKSHIAEGLIDWQHVLGEKLGGRVQTARHSDDV